MRIPRRAFPYPLRRIGTAAFILYVLLLKKLFRVDRQNELTPTGQLGTLSFWGIPEVDVGTYRLQVTGSVQQPIALALEDIKALPPVTRQVRQDCVGGFRNNSIMQGVPLTALFDQVGVKGITVGINVGKNKA